MTINNPLNLNKIDFRAAFAFVGFTDEELKNDPRYVRYIFRITGKKDDEYFERILPHHVCTEEDYAVFSPIQSHYKEVLDNAKKKEGFLCLDWDDTDPIYSYGREEEANF